MKVSVVSCRLGRGLKLNRCLGAKPELESCDDGMYSGNESRRFGGKVDGFRRGQSVGYILDESNFDGRGPEGICEYQVYEQYLNEVEVEKKLLLWAVYSLRIVQQFGICTKGKWIGDG